MKQTLAIRLLEVKKLLQANDEQMAKHLRMSVASYRDLESGARILPLAKRMRINKRIEGLLDRCGLK